LAQNGGHLLKIAVLDLPFPIEDQRILDHDVGALLQQFGGGCLGFLQLAPGAWV
jgi:hypothetical protein